MRQARARSIADTLREWMIAQRKLVFEGSPIAKALDYSLRRWEAFTRYLDDGLPGWWACVARALSAAQSLPR